MPITITPDKIKFCYQSKTWQYDFDEIKELTILKKKKTYYLENGAFMLTTAIAYYCMIFSNLPDLYYIIPALLCYTFIIILRFYKPVEFVYFVLVRDVYEKEMKTKIALKDRIVIGKQIDQYLELQFERNIKKTA
ncbi:hypothetical protein [Flavobacterium hungaricum]|uniref:Uncharacterized protein n=1 Tax=Flavobacterium hungaricum TaxID=2082725 RepID=A0ABR9TPI2_9FLAO|nr:hypothetical protein [Flavobacterium hungaricum]MBE8726912.1 hypothetical protein [Flavobacterium hungaricum]